MRPTQQPFSARLAYTLISLVIIIYGMYILRDLLVPLIFAALDISAHAQSNAPAHMIPT